MDQHLLGASTSWPPGNPSLTHDRCLLCVSEEVNRKPRPIPTFCLVGYENEREVISSVASSHRICILTVFCLFNCLTSYLVLRVLKNLWIKKSLLLEEKEHFFSSHRSLNVILDYPDSAVFATFKRNSQARQGISLLKMCCQDSVTLQNASHPRI